MSLPRARITGTGSYAPERVLTNHDLEKIVDTSDQWIIERSGIRERRIAAEGQNTSDLAREAAERALKAAGLKARQLDLIILATFSPDYFIPSTACMLQKKLGAKHATAFDLNAACSGFLYGLDVAEKYIRSGAARRVMVVGSEVLSRFLNWKDRGTCVLFGDGAGAVILEAHDGDSGILSSSIHSDGAHSDLLCMPGGGSALPAGVEGAEPDLFFIHMKGNETFKVAVKTLEKVAQDTLKKNKLKPQDLALLIPHQANIRIIKAVAERLRIPLERVMLNLDRYGNTSAASIPLAMDEALRSGRIREGDYIMLEAFGGGLTWGSVLIKW